MAYIRQIYWDPDTRRWKTGWTPKTAGRPPAKATWEVVVSLGRDLGGRPRQRTKRVTGTYTAAKEIGHRLEAQTSGRKADASTVTVGELVDRYIEHRRALGRARKTIVGYESIARRVKPALGPIKAGRLSAADLDHYYTSLLGDGRDATTVGHHHAFISQVLNQAAKWDLVSLPHAADRASPPAIFQPDPVSPPPAVAQALIEAFAKEHPMMAVLVYLAAMTGCRRGEVCGWRWSYFDLEAGQLLVKRSVTDAGGLVEEKSTKTRRPRPMALDIRVSAVVLALWDRYVADCELMAIPADRETFVFSQMPDHTVPWRPDRVTHTFGRLRAREAKRVEADLLGAGTSPEVAAAARDQIAGVQLAQMRRFSATQLLGGGVDVRTASARLGHDAAVMLRHYAGVIPANDRAAAGVLADVLEAPSFNVTRQEG